MAIRSRKTDAQRRLAARRNKPAVRSYSEVPNYAGITMAKREGDGDRKR